MAVRQMNINFDKITQQVFQFTAKQFPIVTVGLANFILDQALAYWKQTAVTSTVRGWGQRYANTLMMDPVKGAGGSGQVYVDESSADMLFVNMMENGVKSWSIKDALLQGKAARRNLAKYGKLFVTVPFRFRTPGKGAKKSSGFAGVMPKDIYEIVKSGKRLSKAPDNMPHIAGLKRYGSPLHGQYLTFRTVTENSPGWQYPNIPATPVFEKVQKKVEGMIGELINNMIVGFGRDLQKQFK